MTGALRSNLPYAGKDRSMAIRFRWLRTDARLLDMLAVMQNKMDPESRCALESV